MRDLTNPHVQAVLSTGLSWMYDVEQPANALIHHLGVAGPRVGTRSYGFCPTGAEERPVITVHVARPNWSSGNNATLLNPMGGADEMKQMCALVEELGYQVREWWNGQGESGSIGLVRPAHRTLRDAVRTYKAGCATHPKEGVFCKCDWSTAGRELLVDPVWPTSPDGEDAYCRICWCTENAACPGGCWWANDDQQLAAGLDPMTGDTCTACLISPAPAHTA